jgi:hypothetical protein
VPVPKITRAGDALYSKASISWCTNYGLGKV